MISFRRIGFFLIALFVLLFELGCGDQYRPVANPIIGPGGQPQPTHGAFVVSYNPAGPGSVMGIDVSGDTVSQLTTVGLGSVAELLFGGTGIFVANRDADSVMEYNTVLTSPVVTTVNLPVGARPVALATTQGGVVYVLNSGATENNCPNSGSISTISTTTLVTTNIVCVGKNPTQMIQLPGGGELYVINQGDNSVSIYSPTAQTVSTVTTANGLGLNPTALTSSMDGSFVFVATAGDGVNPGTLDILPRYSGTVGASVPLGVNPVFEVLDTNLNRLYVANKGSNTVSVFDASNVNVSNSPAIPLLGTASVGTGPIGVAPLPSGTQFYVANAGSNDVTVVNTGNFTALTTVALPAGANPVWIASEPGSSRVYVANAGAGTISIIHTVNNSLAVSLSAPPQVSGCTSSCVLQQPQMILTN